MYRIFSKKALKNGLVKKGELKGVRGLGTPDPLPVRTLL